MTLYITTDVSRSTVTKTHQTPEGSGERPDVPAE